MKPQDTTKKAAEIDLNSLTPEQKDALRKQFLEEEKARQTQYRDQRLTYKQMVSDEVTNMFPLLEKLSEQLAEAKKKVFDTLKTFISMKAELYDREEDQNRHSFSNQDGSITIEIGYNENDAWDDTVNVGIGKVNDYMQSLAKDKMSKDLVNMVMKLLSKDSKGNLKASRVIQLRQLADKNGDQALIDAIQIIQDAHRPVRSKEFVRCFYKKDNGEKAILPLSITDAELPKNIADEK